MIHPRQAPVAHVAPAIVCEFPQGIPERGIEPGAWMVVTNLGEPNGAVISYHPNPATVQDLLTHPSAHVYALPSSPSPKRFLSLSK